MEPYKEETRRAYDAYPDRHEQRFVDHFSHYVQPFADEFLTQLNGRTIVDLGSGPGTHAFYFYQRGLDVLCVDFSEEMLKKCAAKGIKVLLKDIEDFTMPPQTVDGVWAHTSLLHIEKQSIPKIIQNIYSMLKPKGLFSLSVKQGEGEGLQESDETPGVKRWYSLFTKEEMRALLVSKFEILSESETIVSSGRVFLNFLARKKS